MPHSQFFKELETEKTAANLVRESARGGYQIVTTPELKTWVDRKKAMLIIDTMPLEDSNKKQHLPGAVHYEFPIPEVKEMDDAAKVKFENRTKTRFWCFIAASPSALAVITPPCGPKSWATRTFIAVPAASRPGLVGYPVEKVQ